MYSIYKHWLSVEGSHWNYHQREDKDRILAFRKLTIRLGRRHTEQFLASAWCFALYKALSHILSNLSTTEWKLCFSVGSMNMTAHGAFPSFSSKKPWKRFDPEQPGSDRDQVRLCHLAIFWHKRQNRRLCLFFRGLESSTQSMGSIQGPPSIN